MLKEVLKGVTFWTGSWRGGRPEMHQSSPAEAEQVALHHLAQYELSTQKQ